MAIGLNDEAIRQSVLSAMSNGTPLATYRKATRSRLLVRYLDSVRLIPMEVILKGDADDPEVPEESYTISVWSEAEDKYLKKMNRPHFNSGLLIPHRSDLKTDYLINQISDQDIDDLLLKSFPTLKSRVSEFTSPVPVRRLLVAAERLNRPIKTINFLKESLSKMEQDTAPQSLSQSQGVMNVIELEL